MAVPRIFISSTFYDLRQVRNNIGDFIKSIGYEPVMHERAGVTYTQTNTLEQDCYREILSCDILICIIGNHFGTKADSNTLSITMNELYTAIKEKKKIYIFIYRDIMTENRVYEQNKNNTEFKAAYADDIKIHDFILELKMQIKYNPIEVFDSTDDIISKLRMQFAGVFQSLLTREATLTDGKTAYDLQKTADDIKNLINECREEKEEFINKFEGSIFATNYTLTYLRKKLCIEHTYFFAKNLEALDELMILIGFESIDCEDIFVEARKYRKEYSNKVVTITMDKELFDESNNLKDIRKVEELEKHLKWIEEEVGEVGEEELPFS